MIPQQCTSRASYQQARAGRRTHSSDPHGDAAACRGANKPSKSVSVGPGRFIRRQRREFVGERQRGELPSVSDESADDEDDDDVTGTAVAVTSGSLISIIFGTLIFLFAGGE